MASRRSIKAYVLLLIAIVELGLLPLALDVGGSILGTFTFLFYTFLTGTIVSLAMVFALRKYDKLVEILSSRRTLFMLIISGILNYGIVSVFLTIGTIHTSASIAGVTYRSWVLFMVLFIPFILKVRVTPYQVLSLLIGFAAIYIALTQGTLLSINAGYAPYVLILLAAALSAAVSNLLIKGQNADLAVEIFIFNVFTFAFIAIIMFGGGIPIGTGINAESLLAVLFAGGIVWSLGALSYFYALKTLEPTIIGNATLLVPFLTFGFAYLFLNEPIYPYYIVLAGLVVLGVLIQRMSPKKAPERIFSGNVSRSMQVYDITSAFSESKNPAVYNYIKEGRALGVIGENGQRYDDILKEKKRKLAYKYNCMLFTTTNPGGHANNEELEFISEILGLDGGKSALIGIGKPENVEGAFHELNDDDGDV
jgi:drug/metabolite transporter (DMT)-like permease